MFVGKMWSASESISIIGSRATRRFWGESNPGNWRENNCIVVTAKGQPFRSGIMLDCWRHLGHLYFGPVVADTDPYLENRAYARFVLARSAARNSSGANHHFAFHSSAEARGKTDD